MNSNRWLYSLVPTRANLHIPYFAPMMEIWSQITKAVLISSGVVPTTTLGNSSDLSQKRNDKKKDVGPIISEEHLQSFHECFTVNMGYKTFETAVLILKTARILDSRLQNNEDIDAYFDMLQEISKQGINAQSFTGKTVIAVEGLEACGKSLLISSLVQGCSDVTMIASNTIPVIKAVTEQFLSLPAPIERAFATTVNYFIAYEILKSRNRVFIIENYHHALCAKNVAEEVVLEVDIHALNEAVFEWPFDLPVPELVR
jgi:hypothetical protein